MSDNVTQPVEGLAFIEFELKLPSATVSSGQTVFPHIAKITESVFNSCETEISFRVTNTIFHNQILRALNSQGKPLIRFRWGTGDGGKILWTPWQLHYVYTHQANFESVGPNAGHYIKLVTKDILHLINRASHTRSYKGTVSDIVKLIASSNGMTDTVIEPTSGQGLWIQSFEGDFSFVRERLLRRARSKRGRGNYYLYVRDNVLHFHTLEYQTSVKALDYYSSPGVTLEAHELTQAKLEDGAAGVRTVTFNPFTGESKELLNDPAKAIRLGNTLARLDKIEGAQLNLQEHAIPTRDEDCGSQATTQNAYEYARAESYQLRMSGNKVQLMRPGEILRLNIDPSAGNISTWSGLYLVATAQQIIDKGVITSVYVLQRGELQVARSNSSDLAAYGVDSLQDDQMAPGYDVNLRDAASSTVTKGAGKALSSGVYLTVQDKNKAILPSS